MRDRGLLVGGLALFVAVITFPVWYNVAAGTPTRGPEPVRPAGTGRCVGPTEYMRASHMSLLMAWRDDVVRGQDRNFVGPDGKTYAKSLTRTCLGCHTSKAEFCDRCHDYGAVKLTCWECHIDPASLRKAQR
ncbi:MAG: hypothetical protein A2X52_03130 [Candidatus Rokubacteria bacterium GWC2_70_16]|nr:MAG: hypothetical protein A2X52_03130 [Candidatus Rokubacteria bacterium GWC2_70_16]OGL14041.1 MAG: hypothetical protein A3K12_07635 [Candidatus Rokubacteria bacterium RIFCSPLOWO2_12_FULL_71_19]